VVVAHHSDLLRLLQHVVDPVGGAVQHDVRLGRVLDLFQQRPAKGITISCNARILKRTLKREIKKNMQIEERNIEVFISHGTSCISNHRSEEHKVNEEGTVKNSWMRTKFVDAIISLTSISVRLGPSADFVLPWGLRSLAMLFGDRERLRFRTCFPLCTTDKNFIPPPAVPRPLGRPSSSVSLASRHSTCTIMRISLCNPWKSARFISGIFHAPCII